MPRLNRRGQPRKRATDNSRENWILLLLVFVPVALLLEYVFHIVAVARRLLIALWRYLETGVLPEGAVLKA